MLRLQPRLNPKGLETNRASLHTQNKFLFRFSFHTRKNFNFLNSWIKQRSCVNFFYPVFVTRFSYRSLYYRCSFVTKRILRQVDFLLARKNLSMDRAEREKFHCAWHQHTETVADTARKCIRIFFYIFYITAREFSTFSTLIFWLSSCLRYFYSLHDCDEDDELTIVFRSVATRFLAEWLTNRFESWGDLELRYSRSTLDPPAGLPGPTLDRQDPSAGPPQRDWVIRPAGIRPASGWVPVWHFFPSCKWIRREVEYLLAGRMPDGPMTYIPPQLVYASGSTLCHLRTTDHRIEPRLVTAFHANFTLIMLAIVFLLLSTQFPLSLVS